MEFRQLRYALALAEIGNFARAADVLCITQPALTRSVQALEESLGVQIFNRSKRAVTVTTDGELVISHAKKVIFEADSLKRELELNQGLEKGEIKLGMGPYVTACYAARSASAMLQEAPNIDIKLTTDGWSLLLEQLFAERIEFFIADVRAITDVEAIDIHHVVEHQVSAFCRKGHPIKDEEKVTFDVVMSYPNVAMEIPELVKKDLPGARIAFETNNISVLRDVVLTSDAICYVSDHSIANDLKSGSIEKIEVIDPPLAFINFGIVSLKGRKLSRAAELFLDVFSRVSNAPL